MRIFFSVPSVIFEGRIQAISIGLVRDDGKEYYAENANLDTHRFKREQLDKVDFNTIKAGDLQFSDWIQAQVREFSKMPNNLKPQWWGVDCAHDWVAFCQLMNGNPTEGVGENQLNHYDVLQYAYHNGFNLWLFPNKFGWNAIGRARYARYIYSQMRHNDTF